MDFSQTQDDDATLPSSQFSHPSEAEFAHLLDYYGIPWQYEPHTFVLEKDTKGNPVEAFSPDFYLPEQDLYVKVTTIRQKLITKKNRKVRRLRELYPDVNIKLSTRRCFLMLLARWGMADRHDELVGNVKRTGKILDTIDF